MESARLIMMDDKHVEMATEKMMADPTAMQMLFQELVVRHITSRKMKMMMEKPDGKMMSMAGKEMKAMMIDEESVMMAKKEMMSGEESAMMMSHESFAHAGQGSHGDCRKVCDDERRPEDGSDDE